MIRKRLFLSIRLVPTIQKSTHFYWHWQLSLRKGKIFD
jgi:hypothetical protein